MRIRDREVYRKDKYSDKRDRRGGNDRDSDSYRTNHDRGDRRGGGGGSGAKLGSSSSGDKRSGSDDRDRERDRDLRDLRDKRDRGSDRDRDIYKKDKYLDKRERSDRGERVARCGDWSEHVSSSGKMYYYNCKTEVSQWEKPKEWLERERNITREQHREKDYRDKERDRDRDDRFSRSAYTKHSSSRANSRLRWNYDNDGPPTHRRRLDGRHNDNIDMDISGDSTPTSEASYSIIGTPTTHGGSVSGTQHNDQLVIPSTNIGMVNALPRLASHPNPMSSSSVSSTAVAIHYSTTTTAGGMSVSGGNVISNTGGIVVGGATMLPASGLSSVSPANMVNSVIGSVASSGVPSSSVSVGVSQTSNLRKLEPLSQHHSTHLVTASNTTISSLSNQVEHHHNSNAPGPPSTKLMIAKEHQDILLSVQHKSSLIMRQQHQPSHHHHLAQHGIVDQSHHVLVGGGSSTDGGNHVAYTSANIPVSAAGVISLRDNSLNSPLYNLTHPHHNMSPLNYTKSPLTTIGGQTNNVSVVGSVSCNVVGSYACNPPFGLKTVDGSSGNSSCSSIGVIANNVCSNIGVIGISTGVGGFNNISSIGSNSLCSSSSLANVVVGVGHIPVDGPPTPTQELDLSGSILEQQQLQQRKLDGTTSASLSSLQSCVATSVQVGRLQGPEISPKLAKYYRADLITHVTNWQADVLEKQAQKCSEDTHLYGDLTCTKVCTELKCARSLVRITEINATLQEQKVMYLRQQIRRIEESKIQNSFMSDDL